MIRRTIIFCAIFIGLLVAVVLADEKKDNQVKFFDEMDKCYLKEECNNPLEINILNKWYFPAEQGNSYGVFGFKFNRVNKQEGAKEKEAESAILVEYMLFVRAYLHEEKTTAEGKQNYLQFSAKVPPQSSSNNEILAYAFPAKAGKYKVVMAITDLSYTIKSLIAYELEFPSFVSPNKIISSSPIFLKKIVPLQQADSVFTIWKDVFHLGIGEIYPYFENRFKNDEQPTLFMQLFGLALNEETSAYEIEYSLIIKRDGKEEMKFKSVQANAPGIVQPIILKKDGKGLETGDYLLEVSVEDKVSGKKLQKEIPFSII